jgi:hypothetical protein
MDGTDQVVLSTNTGYDLELQDSFLITGETDRFAGAPFCGMTGGYVIITTSRTGHTWPGAIAINK